VSAIFYRKCFHLISVLQYQDWKKMKKRNFFYQTFLWIAPIYYLGILYYTVTFIFKLPFGLVRNQRFLYLVLFLISFFYMA
jgi:hypothetical protein